MIGRILQQVQPIKVRKEENVDLSGVLTSKNEGRATFLVVRLNEIFDCLEFLSQLGVLFFSATPIIELHVYGKVGAIIGVQQRECKSHPGSS